MVRIAKKVLIGNSTMQNAIALAFLNPQSNT